MRTIAFLLVGLAATNAQAISKCTDLVGKVTYTDMGCPSATREVAVKATLNTVDMGYERRAALRIDRQREADEALQAKMDALDRAEASSRQPQLECDEAIARYDKMFRGGGATKYNAYSLPLTPEAVAVRAKCGAGTVPSQALPNPPPATAGVAIRTPIPSTQGGFFTPAAGGYYSPQGQFCASAAGGLQCGAKFVPLVR